MNQLALVYDFCFQGMRKGRGREAVEGGGELNGLSLLVENLFGELNHREWLR